jgi:surfeit locus 1 family protein
MSLAGGGQARRRSPLTLFALGSIAMLLIATLMALGLWQLQRRVWKLDLISRIDQRIHAPAVDAPGPTTWPTIDAARDAYRHVRTEGEWLQGRDTLVQAVTALGGGFWVLTPMQTDAGFTLLVNRGFVPAERADRGAATGRAVVSGLLRMSELKGGFLRSNDPSAGRWFSRDVAAIAHARDLQGNAPYFLDADRTLETGGPIGGMTVVEFPNSHLVYAFTWFALALMLLAGTAYVMREEWRAIRARSRLRNSDAGT